MPFSQHFSHGWWQQIGLLRVVLQKIGHSALLLSRQYRGGVKPSCHTDSHTPGSLYEFQNKGLTKFAFRKLLILKGTCDVPEHKLQLGLLKIGLATFDRRQAVQAQMRPLMIVVLQKFVQDPHAGLGRARPMNRKTFLVQSPKESFDLSVRFWVPRSRPPVFDAQAPAGLLEAGLPLRMKRITHGEDEVVVGHHRFDPIRQFGYEPLQKRRCIVAAAIRTNLRDRFAGKVVHTSKSILPLGVFPTVEVLQIQVHQLTRSALFVTSNRFLLWQAQAVASVPHQHAMHTAVADAQNQRNPRRAPTTLSQLQDLSPDTQCQPARRSVGPPRAGLEPRSPLFLVAHPPTREHRTGDACLSTQNRKGFSLLVHSHQQFPLRKAISHSTHAPPPGGSSYRV